MPPYTPDPCGTRTTTYDGDGEVMRRVAVVFAASRTSSVRRLTPAKLKTSNVTGVSTSEPLVRIKSLSVPSAVAMALTPSRTSGIAADWIATSPWADSRRAVESTAPVTGWSLLSLIAPGSPANPAVRSTSAVLSGSRSRLSAPEGANSPWMPSAEIVTAARTVPGLVTTGRRTPSPSGTAGMMTEAAGGAAPSCQSAPAGSPLNRRNSRATAAIRPELVLTATDSGPSVRTSTLIERVRVLRPATAMLGLPGTATRPRRPKNRRSTTAWASSGLVKINWVLSVSPVPTPGNQCTVVGAEHGAAISPAWSPVVAVPRTAALAP